MRNFVVIALLLAGTLALNVEAEPTGNPRLATRVDVAGDTPAPEGLAGRLRLTALDRPDDAPMETTFQGASESVVSLPGAGAWEICAWSAGYWSPCRRVTADSDGEQITSIAVTLWPSAVLVGRLEWPDRKQPSDAALPHHLGLEFSPSDASPVSVPSSESSCPVDGDGRWRCSVPAGLLDLVVRPVGYVPDYRWEVRANAGSEVDLGSLVLRSGASVSGYVEAEEVDFDAAACVVELTPMVSPGAGSSAAERLSEVRYAAKVNPRGFFQVTGVPPGVYVAEARQAGSAPARLAPVEVWEESETVLRDPLILRPPLSLAFELSPPVDWVGRPWKVSLVPASGVTGGDVSERPEEKQAGDDGLVSFPGHGPGLYRVQVFDALGQSFHVDPEVAVHSAADARRRIDLPMVSVAGAVRIGSEPLAAKLFFGGRYGGFRSEIEADEDGEFVGALPKPGLWRVLVEADEPEIATELQVDVDPGDSSHATLDIEIPDTEVFGQVVDGGEAPVAGVRVTLRSAGLGAAATTDATGNFSLRGFEPGAVSLTARHRAGNRELDADTVLAQVADGQTYGPIKLRLLGTKTRRGRVVTDGGVPVAGAVLMVSTLRPETATFSASARSALDGSFEVQVRENTAALQVVARASGYALTAVETTPEEPIVVEVPRETALLQVSLGELTSGADATISIFRNGLALPPPVLSAWARGHGESFDQDAGLIRIPALAPGRYQACLGAPSRLTAAALEQGDWRRGFDVCADGFLSVGSELHLDLATRQDSSTHEKETDK